MKLVLVWRPTVAAMIRTWLTSRLRWWLVSPVAFNRCVMLLQIPKPSYVVLHIYTIRVCNLLLKCVKIDV